MRAVLPSVSRPDPEPATRQNRSRAPGGSPFRPRWWRKLSREREARSGPVTPRGWGQSSQSS